MILQALNDYYLRCQRSPDLQERLPNMGFEEKEIPFIIEIDGGGRVVNVADTRTMDGKKKVGRHYIVPQGAKKTSGIAANFRLVSGGANEPAPISETRELGFMLHDLDFTHPADPAPRFFRARLENGAVEVPAWNSAEVRG